MPKRSILNFCAIQKEDGRIPLYGPDTLPVSPHHSRQINGASSLPTLFPAAYRLVLMSGNRSLAEKIYHLLARYSDWWKNNRIDKATGLVSALFEETFPPYLGCAGEYVGVDTCVLTALGADYTAKLAALLGNTSEEKRFAQFSRDIFDAAENHLWDESEGLFRARDLRTGEFSGYSTEGFYMLADPQLPTQRKQRLMEALTGKYFGWNRFPLTSARNNAPEFTLTRGDAYQFNASWSGMTWTLINRFVISGLLTAGHEAEAALLAEKTLSMVEKANECREFYDPTDGSGHGARDYAWTASHTLLNLIEFLCGVHYDGFSKELTIRPRFRLLPSDSAYRNGIWRLENLCCGEDGLADIIISDGQIADCSLHNVRTDIRINIQNDK